MEIFLAVLVISSAFTIFAIAVINAMASRRNYLRATGKVDMYAERKWYEKLSDSI